MAVTLEEELKGLEVDVEWLHSNYNDLIDKYNQQFVAIRNCAIIAFDEDLNKLKEKLKENGIKPGEVLAEYIRDRRNQII